MKNLFLVFATFLLFSSAEAQLFKKVKKIVPVTSVPKVLEVGAAPFDVSFKLLDKNNVKVKGKKISISVEKGRSQISNISEKSDSDGIVSFKFTPASFPENSIVKVQYAPITSKVTDALDLEDSSVITYFQEIKIQDLKVDMTKSRSQMTSAKKLVQGNAEIIIQVEMKNKFAENIENDSFDFSLSIDNTKSNQVSRVKKSSGVYEYHFKAPKKAGTYDLKLNLDGKVVSDSVVIEPKLDYRNIKVSLVKVEGNRYDISATLKDINGDLFKKVDSLSTRLNSNNKDLQISQLSKLSYSIIVPEGEGSALLDFIIKGEETYEDQQKLDWVYFPYTLSDVYVKAYPENIMATGFDTANLEIHFKNLTNDQISRIALSDGFNAIISSGEGELSQFTLISNEGEQSFLRAIFTSPYTAGKSTFEVHNKLGLIDSEKQISYDVNIIRCESNNVVDYDTMPNTLRDNIRLVSKVIDGMKQAQGFEFVNSGPNDIVPEDWSRKFDFVFPDQAKQLMKLVISHNSHHPDAKDSATTMMTSLYFFPRTSIPRVMDEGGDTIKTTLPTGEEVIFDRKTKKIVGGVLEEGPVDAREDRFSRTFPDIRYKGKGYVLRANARGQMPESGNYNRSKISGEFGHKGAEGAMIYHYNEETQKTESCVVAKSKVFKKLYHEGMPQNNDNEIGSVFRFATDEEFYDFVEKNCKFN